MCVRWINVNVNVNVYDINFLQELHDNVEVLCEAAQNFYKAGDNKNAKAVFQRVRVISWTCGFLRIDLLAFVCKLSKLLIPREFFLYVNESVNLIIYIYVTNDLNSHVV